MLKIAHEEEEERRGGRLMAWWAGQGAARVLAHDERAVLLERATGARSLAAMVAAGHDDEATLILRAAAARLHAPHRAALPDLMPLPTWFEALSPAARTHGGLLAEADAVTRELLAAPREQAVLHGDLHHGNLLDGGERGWLAIDPKALWGERTFDFVNILRNPAPAIALVPPRPAAAPAMDTGPRGSVGCLASGRREGGGRRSRPCAPRFGDAQPLTRISASFGGFRTALPGCRLM
jgi:streptomycin 6-kinase